MLDADRTTHLIIGEQKMRTFTPEIQELRQRCGQQDDLLTDPLYFIVANTLKDVRPAAVLIRRNHELVACVLFYEHCRLGLGLGLMRGGNHMGEGLVIAPEVFRLQYIQLATQALLKHWRIHGVSLSIREGLDHCIEVMGPKCKYRMFAERNIRNTLPLETSYQALLASLGPRTRRSLQGKRQQLQKSADVEFLPWLEPAQALEAMLALESRSTPPRITAYFHARFHLLSENPDSYCMGLRLPDGTWLSILSGWRRKGITYVDLQMNDVRFKKESLSAVMRAFMLEHEIACKQHLVNFVGGTSVLLWRYCRPMEQATDIFLWKPSLRAMLFKMFGPRVRPQSVHDRLKAEAEEQASDLMEN